MSFSGVHVSYGEVYAIGRSDVLRSLVWSETMPLAATTNSTASIPASIRGAFLVQPSVDIFVSIGASPNASASPRVLVLAGERVLIPCSYGDKLAWVAA